MSNDQGMAMPTPGAFCWNELMTRDVDAAQEFYGGLLGWTFQSKDMGHMGTYTIIRHGDQDRGGMMQMSGPEWGDMSSHWMAYIAVADVDACAARVGELGGTVCVPPTDIPTVGRFCVINDPTGATVSLMTFTAPG